jgi:predicted RNase H-like nuclease
LLRLLNADYRVPYKASNTTRYWPGQSVPTRVRNLLREYQRILRALSACISDIPLTLPSPEACTSFAFLKRYEDALDALVCAWVGIEFLEGRATAYGDDTAAIWIPDSDDEVTNPNRQE